MKPIKRTNHLRSHLASWALLLAPLAATLAGSGCRPSSDNAVPRAPALLQAVAGRDGVRTVGTANAVVNAYSALGADAAAGAGTITVDSVADLGTNFSQGLAAGDLLLIIQMQGATINTTDTVDYGAIESEAALGSAGRYEFVGVDSVSTGTNQITLACPLKHAYRRAGKTQVVRVPQFTTLTIEGAGSIGAPGWNGTVGGIVAVHAQARVQVDGDIDVSARGFRGGQADNSSDNNTVAVLGYRSGTASQGAEKGESIAGYQDDYVNGRYGRGAPANGGGGGNSHNAGGGGGANGGDPAAWRLGQGVMLETVAGAGAWVLDPGYLANPVAANTRTNSHGGGRGGYSYSESDQDALAVGPGNASWGGNSRREVGGLGGRPLVGSPSTRLFLGGGGGAGDRNNNSAGSAGGNGGGLVFVIAGSVAGSGRILANGGDAPSSPGGPAGDAPGGGGGGGTVVVNAGSVGGVSIAANGGAGGEQTGSNSAVEVEGPGGGGGGGYIAVSGTGTPSLSAAGGLGGTTNRPAMAEFPSNGATAGHAGITNGSADTFFFCAGGLLTTIATHPSNPTTSSTGVFGFTNTRSPVTYECALDGAAFAACGASYTTPVLADGPHSLSVRATLTAGDAGILVEAPPVTYTWTVDSGKSVTTIATRPTNPTNKATVDFSFTNTRNATAYECKLDAGEWSPCATPFTTPALADGTHTLSVRALTSVSDAGVVKEDPPVVYTWVVDTTPPDTTIATSPAATTTDTRGTFTFTSNESPATFACKLDSAEWGPCGATYATPVLSVGTHVLSVLAIDAAGNMDPTPASFTWNVGVVGRSDAGAPPDAPLVAAVDAGLEMDARDGDAFPVSDTFTDGSGAVDARSDGRLVDAEAAKDSVLLPLDSSTDTAFAKVDAIVVPSADATNSAKLDAANSTKADAAEGPVTPRLLGGGFCSVSRSRAPRAVGLFPLALVGLALLHRRRKSR